MDSLFYIFVSGQKRNLNKYVYNQLYSLYTL